MNSRIATGLSRLAWLRPRFVRLVSLFGAGFSGRTAGHFSATCLVWAFCLFAGAVTVKAAGSDLVTITTPRGARQAFILIKPDKPTAAVILFAGGHGGLGLKSATEMKWGAQNFLVRSRDRFAAEGLMVAVMDAPGDRPKGMNAIFRMGASHAEDIGAVAAYLKAQADVPVWLVGTSMGTYSAAEGAIAAKNVDGLVLSSTITGAKPQWKIAKSHADGVASMPLGSIKVPVLVLAHSKDGCDLSPAAGAPKLAKRLTSAAKVETVLLDGGAPSRSRACEAKAEHGFWGIEDKAVGAIATFIKAPR
jgi:pimeloyl-ACP methyl ester carboxylesterase